jgi:hypothetical protein
MIFLLFINLAFAQSYTTVNFFPSTWGSKALCEQLGGEECFEIQESPDKYKVSVIQVDAKEKPVYDSKSNITACNGLDDCYSKIVNLCVSPKYPVVNPNFLEVYCTKVVSYEQKDKSILVLDAVKEATYAQNKAIAATNKIKSDLIANKMKHCDVGLKVIAMVQLSSESKGLSKSVRDQLEVDLEAIIKKLHLCKLQDAKDLIEAIVPDGVKITTADKSGVLSVINEAL